MDRLRIKNVTLPYDCSNLLVDVDSAVNILLSVKRGFESNGWSNIRLDMTYSYDDCQLILVGERWETDSEYKIRCSRAEKLQQKKLAKKLTKEQSERLLYERLKKKYGP